MIIKAEILLRLLLTLILLLTPLVYIIKNRDSVSKKLKSKREQIINFAQRKTDQIKESVVRKPKEDIVLPSDTMTSGAAATVSHEFQEIVSVPHKKTIPVKISKTQKKKNLITQEEAPKVKSEKDLKKIEEIRNTAITYKERWKDDLYEKKLIEWLAVDQNNKEFLERLSDYYFQQKNYVKATTMLKKIVNTYPDNHKAIWQIWQIYILQEEYDTAKILIQKAIDVRNDHPKYYISLVDIYYAKWDLPQAIKSMEKVLKLRPASTDYLLSIATLHEENWEPNKAISYYSKIIELDPMHTQAKSALQRLS